MFVGLAVDRDLAKRCVIDLHGSFQFAGAKGMLDILYASRRHWIRIKYSSSL